MVAKLPAGAEERLTTETSAAGLKVLRLKAPGDAHYCEVLQVSQLESVLFVGLPDGSALSIEIAYDSPAGRLAAEALTTAMIPTLRPGPVTWNRSAGERRISGRTLGLTVPEGYGALVEEGHCDAVFTLARLTAASEPTARVELIVLNNFDEEPLRRRLPDYRGRRSVGLFGRPVSFLEKRTSSTLSLATRESFVDGHLDVLVEAPNDRLLDELMAIVGSAKLYLNDDWRHTESLPVKSTGPGCPWVVIDPLSPLNVRQTPSGTGDVVGTLPSGTVVDVGEHRSGWMRINAPLEGWAWHEKVRQECLLTPADDTAPDESSDQGAEIRRHKATAEDVVATPPPTKVGHLSSAQLRGVFAKVRPATRRGPRCPRGECLRVEATTYRLRRGGPPEPRQLQALLLRNSGGAPEDPVLLWSLYALATLECASAVATLAEDGLDEEQRSRLDSICELLQSELTHRPDLIVYAGRWLFADAVGALGSGFLVVDRNTSEVLWLRITQSWSG